MGVFKLSSRTACFLLWLFIVHSVQVCALTVPSIASKKEGSEEVARKAAAANAGIEKDINRPDASNAAAPLGVEHSESKKPVDSGGSGDPIKVVQSEPTSTAESKAKWESKDVQSPLNRHAQVKSNQGHRDRVESGESAQKPSMSPAKPLAPKPASAPVVEQQESKVGHPASTGSDKSTANAAVDVGKMKNSGVNNTAKHPEDEKTSVKKPLEGSAATVGASLAATSETTETTTLAQEKTLAATTLKPAEPAHLVASEHAKLLPGAPSQGQGVEKKYSGTVPDVPKDFGGMASASTGNVEYGQLDSGEDLGPPLPTQKNPAVSTSVQLGAQPAAGSVGGSRPEKPLDASAAAGSMPLLPAQDDSHFFAYFLTAVVLCVVGYLAFHNKRKILALILEGRHERQRRHNGHYRRLDSVDDASAVRKGRGSF